MNAVIQRDSDDHSADPDGEKLWTRKDENGQSRGQQSREKGHGREQQAPRVAAVDEDHEQR